jgi:hypothetical protein
MTMPITVVLHISGSEPVLAEIDELPEPDHTLIRVNNPRKVDGKDLHYLADKVVTVYWPIDKLSFIEVLPTEEEDRIISFVRE